MRKKIGVIIATYNGEKYIKEQLDSIVNQSEKPNYILISDGGSKDNTVKICDDYLSKKDIDYRIIKSKKPLSVKDNFECGLLNCNTDYIFFSDQDDYWLNNKIKNAMQIFEKEGADVVFCNAFIVNDELKKSGQTLWQKIGYNPSKKITIYDKNSIELHNELLKHNIMTGMCMAINDKIKKLVIPFSNNSIHDVWIAHCSNCIGKVVSIDSKDVLYRQHLNNVIGTKKNLSKSFKNRKYYLEKLNKRYNFINDLITKVDLEKEINNSYNDYKLFISKRIMFIKKQIRFSNIFSLKKEYKKYVYNYKKIIMKDIYSRFNFKRNDLSNE